MKLIITSLVISFVLLSCKKESQNTAKDSDTITTPETENSVPAPAHVDTLVAAPKSDTANTKTDSSTVGR